MRSLKALWLLTLLVLTAQIGRSQLVPALEENIPFLVTFGSEADKDWGDDDFCQVFFFSIPETHKAPVFIRVFDPETGGKHDEAKQTFDTRTKFSILGGRGCISDDGAKSTQPQGKYFSGNLLEERIFGSDPRYDDKWFVFGPFNPQEGEYMPEYGGYIIKVIAKGVAGNDGNLYRYAMSTTRDANNPVKGANAFTFEYTFRLYSDPKQVSHLYPYVDNQVVSLRQSNFDLDNQGAIKIVSTIRNGEIAQASGDGNWLQSEHEIYKGERNSSLDIQFHQNSDADLQKNNVVFYITNQYGENLPFYTVPIGGVPKPKPSLITVKPAKH